MPNPTNYPIKQVYIGKRNIMLRETQRHLKPWRHRRLKEPHIRGLSFYWVAVKELNSSYHNMDI